MGIDGSEILKKRQVSISIGKNKNYVTITALLIFIASFSFFLGRATVSKNNIESTIQNNVHEEIQDQFGWGKINNDSKLEVTHVIKGIIIKKAYNNTRVPAIQISLKNIGKNKIETFGLTYSFKNTTDKINIGTTAIASGSIESGWETAPIILEANTESFIKIASNNSCFDIHLKVYATRKDGKHLIIYETDFSKEELVSLKEIRL